jgi:hypothetical protein
VTRIIPSSSRGIRFAAIETRRGDVAFEYRTEVLTGGFMGRHKEELKRSDLERQLTDAGRDGWELTQVLMEQALQGEKDGHVLIFRRSAA